jgi:hypothetical protein
MAAREAGQSRRVAQEMHRSRKANGGAKAKAHVQVVQK